MPEAAAADHPRWVLLRAFGPPQAVGPAPIEGSVAAALAAQLGLVERIGARLPSAQLVSELGRDAARQMALARLRALAGVRGLCDLIPELAALAREAAVPVVLLKFAALHTGGYLAEDSRAAADLDILVPEREVERAARWLTGRGFFAAERALADHHHFPPLHDRRGRVVELHTRLPGIQAPGARRFADFEALDSAGGLEPASGAGHGCRLLRRELLAAHAIVHGFAQHGGADAYPVTRALADTIDLFPADCRAARPAVARWLAPGALPIDLGTILGLCDALRAGDLDGLANGAEGALLRDVLAGALDAEHRRAVAVSHLFHGLSDEPRWRLFLRTVRSLVWPTRSQLAGRLGLSSARPVTFRLRLAHTLALAGRLPGHARAALRMLVRSLPRPTNRRARR